MQQNERSAEQEVNVVRFLRLVHSSILALGIDNTIPKAKNSFIKVWLNIVTPQIIRWLALIETLLEEHLRTYN
jgi:hypothetical protein